MQTVDPLERSRRRLAYLDEALKRTLEIQRGKLTEARGNRRPSAVD